MHNRLIYDKILSGYVYSKNHVEKAVFLMKKTNIINRSIYIGISIVAVILMLSGLLSDQGKSPTWSSSMEIQTIEAYDTQFTSSDQVVYCFDLDNTNSHNMAISFLSRHQEVNVLVDGHTVYDVQAEKSLYGVTTGAIYNVVSLPYGSHKVVITLTNVYDNVKIKDVEFFYGDETDIVTNMLLSDLPSAVMCCVILFIGIMMVVFWALCRKKFELSQALLYFGIFAVVTALWTLNETNVFMMLISDRKLASFIAFTLLMMMPIPFVLAERFFFEMKDTFISNLFCLIYIVTDTVLFVCHVTGIWEYKQSAPVIHILLASSLIYMVGVIVKKAKYNSIDRRVKSNIIAVSALGISLLADMFAFYKGLLQTDIFGKIGILICIIMLAIESASDAFAKISEGRKAETYLNMAITDAMTNMYNRMAFDNWENSTTDFLGMGIVTFDLNNLKWCNDNLGHSAGDAYIEAAAVIIQSVFGKYGNCYRIGGDEFCTVMERASKVNIESCIQTLRKKEKKFEKEKKNHITIQIACGYAIFNPDTDQSFEDTRNRADIKMYESKKELKNL